MDDCEGWSSSGSDWLYSCPWCFRNLLNFIHKKWDSNKFPIYVTENGISSSNYDITNGTDWDPNLDDQFRANFYHGESFLSVIM